LGHRLLEEISAIIITNISDGIGITVCYGMYLVNLALSDRLFCQFCSSRKVMVPILNWTVGKLGILAAKASVLARIDPGLLAKSRPHTSPAGGILGRSKRVLP
jgi:hypothetical protein